jgi:hypothetical protein
MLKDETIPQHLMVAWVRWHNDNPDFYRLFCRFTHEAISRGHRNLSAWLIVNRIRWETSVVTHGDVFKIRNDYIALFSRLFMRDNPQYKGFFRTRPMGGRRARRDDYYD